MVDARYSTQRIRDHEAAQEKPLLVARIDLLQKRVLRLERELMRTRLQHSSDFNLMIRFARKYRLEKEEK